MGGGGLTLEWLVLEEVDDGAARLVAVQPSTGARRLLYRSDHPFPLRPSIHPDGTRIVLDAISRNVLRGEYRARVGVVNLENGGVGWLRHSLDPKWRVGGAVFDDTGRRLAIEAAYGGAPLTDIYVVETTFTGNSVKETIVAGAGNRQQLGTAAPRFLTGGRRLVYLQNARPDGAWEVRLLDLDQSGDSAFSLEGRATSVLSMPLTEGADALPEGGLSFSPERGRVFFVGQTRGRTRQRLRWTPVDGGGVVDLGREHLRVEEVAAAPVGDLVAYSADGRIWLADAESCECFALVKGETTDSHRGLVFDEEQGCLWFCTTDGDGARLRVVDLDTRSVRDVLTLGPGVSVVHGLPLPENARAHALVEARPEPDAEPPRDGADEALDEGAATTVTRLPVALASPAATLEAPPPGMGTVPDYRSPELATTAEAPPVVAPGPSSPGLFAPILLETGTSPNALELDNRSRTEVTPLPKKVHEPEPFVPPALPAPPAAPKAPPEPRLLGARLSLNPIPAVAAPPVAAPVAAAPVAVSPAAAPAGAPVVPSEPESADVPTGVHRVEKPRLVSATPPADPRDDFVGWMRRLGEAGSVGDALRRLSSPELLADAQLRDSARMYLGLNLRKAGLGEGLAELVNAIGAAGYLRLHESEAGLKQLCERCRERLRAEPGLPEVEEHYALAAVRAIRLGQRFDFDEIYEEYETMLAQSAAVLDDAGEVAMTKLIATFSQMYLDLIEEALDLPVNPLSGSAEARRARQRMNTPMAAVASAAPARTQTLTGLVAPRVVTERASVDVAPAALAAPAAATATTAASTASRAVPTPALASRVASPQDDDEIEWQRLRSHADSQAPRIVPDADEEAEFRRLRALAEAAPIGRPSPVAPRASVSAFDAQPVDEEEEWARLKARAESTPPPALGRSRTPMDFDPLGPGMTPVPQPGTPLATWPTSPRTGADRWPVPAEGVDFDPLTMGVTGDIRLTMPPPPWFLQVVGGAGCIGGLILLLIGFKLGAIFLLLGAITLGGGFGVLGDRRWGYLAAAPVFAADALYLALFAAGKPPAWVPAMALLFGAAAAALAFVVLLLPEVRARYTSRRGRI